MKRLVLCISFGLYLSMLSMLVFSTALANVTGPHNIPHRKGVCANCHVPHYAKGERIWARKLSNNFGGARKLCNSCHDGTLSQNINRDYPDLPVVQISSGIDTVFGEEFESHVMHGVVDIQRGVSNKILGTYDYETFPMDPNDSDDAHDPAISEWDKGGEGFYCGSCHNVHIQPQGHEGDGDYLRTTSPENAGKPGERAKFCKQCHDPVGTGRSHFSNNKCEACHHPHEGKVKALPGMLEIELRAARATFRAGVVDSVPFSALPNVPEISDDSDDLDIASSSFCYGCHQPRHLLGPDDPNYTIWMEVGAAPIYGDTASDFKKNIDIDMKNYKQFEHHPMGTEAALNGRSQFSHATGSAATENLNKNGQLTCISCHADLHGNTEGIDDPVESQENNFLRWEFRNDNAYFCLKCHKDKSMGSSETDLRIQADSRHFWETEPSIASLRKERVVYINDPVQNYETKIPCRQCLFCHFIHDGEERQSDDPSSITIIRPDVDCLMRFPSKALATGERTRTQDVYYEDLCYGCHGDIDVVGGQGSGALLKISLADFPNDYYFSHRFASVPIADNPPAQIMGKGGTFPVSDGPGDPSDPNGVIDDYGTEAGEFYCGSCHNVHAQHTPSSPYLNSGKSLYEVNGFCEACHNADSKFVDNGHPVGKGPNADPLDGSPTLSDFDAIFTQFTKDQPSSGHPGGAVTNSGEMLCLTCHNTHAAMTSWDGKTKTDTQNQYFHGQLLVMDNFAAYNISGPSGSELCKGCHWLSGENDDFPEDKHAENFSDNIHDVTDTRKMGICNACHTPHNRYGPKLWSRANYSSGPFSGYRQLCYTCHNSTIATSGSPTVFKSAGHGDDLCMDPNFTMDHVMHAAADVSAITPVYTFPIDTEDTDTIPCQDSYRTGGEFYCGSCHNPHDQPEFGDMYLRSADGYTGLKNFLNPGRITFCDDCHPDAHDGIAGECFKCHSVHLGAVLPGENETEARWVLLSRIQRKTFQALPNVKGLNEDPTDLQKTDSPFCYGCHGPDGYSEWKDAGARLISGDDDPVGSKEHHPMGDQATSSSPRLNLAPQLSTTPYYNEPYGQLTCKSCHHDIHGPGPFKDDPNPQKAKDNYYLRWELNNDVVKDQVTFCVACHGDKSNLSGEHLVSADPNNNIRGGCMFCHFIHDGEERQAGSPVTGILADVDALMRIKPKNLDWGDKQGNLTINDYEDMCFGCHGETLIVTGGCTNGALLKWENDLHTHRFASAPDPNGPPSRAITNSNGAFPLSDGKKADEDASNALNDYGTVAGTIFCGTCHRVHDDTVPPYLNYEAGDTAISPYAPDSFCEYCHDAESSSFQFVHNSHPIDVKFESTEFPTTYDSGGNGCKGGITYNGYLICLTCHNVHAAATNWKGGVPGDPDNDIHGKLLVKDNFSSAEGSDMCQECHSF